jgi:hypothetical protein
LPSWAAALSLARSWTAARSWRPATVF